MNDEPKDANGDGKQNGLYRSVERRTERRARWEREGERPLWQNLSMIGAFGWLVVAPAVLGALLGRWLDKMFDQGVFWTGSLIFLGAGLGFYLVWQRIRNDP
ncbi:AtpZ/AtpI family protein [Methyloligella sp. 2.7D]|uniref:AtpZ/AtpI family protein n=1 Tax=unclassified Methyloligella TaxID=2625955 RepID=UPI00157C35C5|nr:AtpZ/AtpI family protein [Methyloligella sp. GL2]QKP78129.1 AtpZ/AtpI family protein [Methyloligella sp. GL2]